MMASVQLAGLVTGQLSISDCDTVQQLCERIQELRGVL